MDRSPPLAHHPQCRRQRGTAGAQYAGSSGLINIKRDDALVHLLTGHYLNAANPSAIFLIVVLGVPGRSVADRSCIPLTIPSWSNANAAAAVLQTTANNASVVKITECLLGFTTINLRSTFAVKAHTSTNLRTIPPKRFLATVNAEPNISRRKDWVMTRALGFRSDLVPIPKRPTRFECWSVPDTGQVWHRHYTDRGMTSTITHQPLAAFR